MSDVERFSKLIQKYISFEELDSFMLHELIEKIISLLGIGRFDGSLREFTDRDLQVDIIHLSLNLIDKKKYFPYNLTESLIIAKENIWDEERKSLEAYTGKT